MAKIKQVAKYDGSSWGTPYDLGADAENIDVVTGEDPTTQEEITDNLQNVIDNIQGDISDIQTDLNNKVDTEDLSGFDFTKTYLETTGNSANTVVNGISQNADTSSDIATQAQAIAGESTLTLWNKFNKFVQRVGNKFGEYTTTANLNTLLANKVSKTGDTMTGNLQIQTSGDTSLNLINTGVDYTGAPGANKYETIGFRNGDNNSYVGYVEAYQSSNTAGTIGVRMAARTRNSANTADVTTGFYLAVDHDGTHTVGFSNTESRQAWEKALSGIITYRECEKTFSNMTANSTHNESIPITTVSGYTPIGIIRITSDHPLSFTLDTFSISGTNIWLGWHQTVAQSSQTMTCRVLYIKS